MSFVLRILILVVCAFYALSVARAAEWVELPAQGGTRLKVMLFRPAGSGPFPAVVALHGCGGLGSARQEINARHADWAQRLSAAGFVVAFPESFASRGLGSQCAVRKRDVRSKDRARDAFATAEWLSARPEVARGRIGLLGWSNGGTAVLSASRDIRAPKGVEFAQAVAFYPGCKVMLEEGFRPRIPVTILHGLADNWTAPEPCQRLAGVRFVGFPGAHHDFDFPDLPLRARKAAFSKDGSGTVTVGTHPEARAQAIDRVMAIFKGM